jgi:hypothetical protein
LKVSTSKSSVKRERAKKEDTSVFYGVDDVVNLVIQFLNQTNKTVYVARVRLLIPSDSNKHTLSSISGKLKSQCPLVDV